MIFAIPSQKEMVGGIAGALSAPESTESQGIIRVLAFCDAEIPTCAPRAGNE